MTMKEVYRCPHQRHETVATSACGHTTPFEPASYGGRVAIRCEVCNSDFFMETIDSQGNMTCVWYKDMIEVPITTAEQVVTLMIFEHFHPGSLTTDETGLLLKWLEDHPRPGGSLLT